MPAGDGMVIKKFRSEKNPPKGNYFLDFITTFAMTC